MKQITPIQIADKAIDMFIEELDRRNIKFVEVGEIFAFAPFPETISAARVVAMQEVREAEEFEELPGEGPDDSPKIGIRVTCEDLSGEQDTETAEIQDDYIVVCAGSYYVAHENHYPKTGTVQITIKRDRP